MVELMKAILVEEYGGSEQLKWDDTPSPRPTGDGQVLIKVKAAGINRPDVLQRQGLYQPPPGASPLLGLEVSGIVEQVFGESQWKYGDKVCALTHGGGYAQYVWVDARHCLPIPQNWNFVEAASLPEAYFTVWYNVFKLGQLGKEKPETMLVHAGASGIGVAAIQLAKARGNRVVVTARKEAQLAKCLQFGADEAIVLDENWPTVVTEKMGGVDVVLDILGDSTFEGNLEVLKARGRLIWLAFLTGQKTTLPIAKIMQKQLILTGSFLRPQSADTKAEIAAELRQHIWPLIDQGAIQPSIQSIFPIQEAHRAHDMMERGGHVGKIVLHVD